MEAIKNSGIGISDIISIMTHSTPTHLSSTQCPKCGEEMIEISRR